MHKVYFGKSSVVLLIIHTTLHIYCSADNANETGLFQPVSLPAEAVQVTDIYEISVTFCKSPLTEAVHFFKSKNLEKVLRSAPSTAHPRFLTRKFAIGAPR